MGAVERSRAAKRVRRSEVILRPLAAEKFIQRGCDLYLILLEGNGKAVLIQFVPELIPTR